MMPPCDQTGVPGLVDLTHFHSSTTSGSAFLMSLRILLRVSPRQSSSSAILFEMSSDADWPWLAPDFFMFSSYLTWGSAPHPGSVACGAPMSRATPSRARGARRRSAATRTESRREPHNGLSARRRGLHAAPEEVREPPEHAGGGRPAPRLRAVPHQEVGERLRHLRQAQVRVGGEGYLQAEECGDDPEADDYSFGARDAQVRGREGRSRCGDRLPSGLHVHDLPSCGRR